MVLFYFRYKLNWIFLKPKWENYSLQCKKTKNLTVYYDFTYLHHSHYDVTYFHHSYSYYAHLGKWNCRSAAARQVRLWVWIPPGAWMCVCCECFVLSGRGLCDELITRPEESYRLWCIVVWSRNLKNEEAMTRVGSQHHNTKKGGNKIWKFYTQCWWKSQICSYYTKINSVHLYLNSQMNELILSIWHL